MFLPAKIELSVKAGLGAPGQAGDVLHDSRVHLRELLVQLPAGDKFYNFTLLHSCGWWSPVLIYAVAQS